MECQWMHLRRAEPLIIRVSYKDSGEAMPEQVSLV